MRSHHDCEVVRIMGHGLRRDADGRVHAVDPDTCRLNPVGREVWEPCVACGAPVSVGGAGHDPGCLLEPTDQQIAASMALAAMDNRESWAYGAGGPDWHVMGQPQPRGARTGAPLHLSAQWTAERGYAVWVLED